MLPTMGALEKSFDQEATPANFQIRDVESIASPASESRDPILETRKLQGLVVRHSQPFPWC
jgi:hypothetical protein